MLNDLLTVLAPTGSVVTHLRAWFPDVFSIYAFGSQVQGTAGPESDLDFAILVPGYASPEILWERSGTLADLAGCCVDLIDQSLQLPVTVSIITSHLQDFLHFSQTLLKR